MMRRDLKRRNSVLFGVAFLACSLCLPSSSARRAPASVPPKLEKKGITFRLQGEPETLDWNRAHTPIEMNILSNLMEGLVSFDSSFHPVPDLAESWKISPDRKIYTFKLREGVLWSDGVLLRAQDFVESWKRLLSPETAASYAYMLYDIVGAEAFNKGKIKDFGKVGVHALDDRTLEVELHAPVAHWLSIPTFWVTYPIRKDVIEKFGASWEQPGHMVTLGPYILAKREIESRIVLAANPKYFGKKNPVDEVTIRVVGDDHTALRLYESGKIDVLPDLPSMDIRRLKDRPDFKVFPYLKTVYLGFSVGTAAVKERLLRQAISYALNKAELVEVLAGGQKAAGSFVPPPLPGYSSFAATDYNPEEARKLMDLVFKGAQPQEPIEVLLPNYEKSLVVGQWLQDQLKKNLGLNISLQAFDNKTYRARLDLRQSPIFLTSWSADYPDPDNFLSIFMSDSGNNRCGWKNTQFDNEVLMARYHASPSRRKEIYRSLQKFLLRDQAVVVPLYYEPVTALVNPRFKNVEFSPLNLLDFRKVSFENGAKKPH